MRDKKYNGLMGMTEMEIAVEILEKKALAAGISFEKVSAHPTDFLPKPDEKYPDYMPLIGFCQLLARGWMEADYPNSKFIPSKDLIKRLNERWGTNYPDPKHLWEQLAENLDLIKNLPNPLDLVKE